MDSITFKSLLQERDLCKSRSFDIKDLTLEGNQYFWSQDNVKLLVRLSQEAKRQLCDQLSIPYSFYFSQCNQHLREEIFNTSVKELYKPKWSSFSQVFVADLITQEEVYEFKSFSMPFTYVKSSDLFEKAIDLFVKDRDFNTDDVEISHPVLSGDRVKGTLLSPKQEEVVAGDFVQLGLEVDFPDRSNKSLALGSYLYRLICMNGAISPFASNLRRKLKGVEEVTAKSFLANFSHVFSHAVKNVFSSLDGLSALRDVTFTGDISKVIKQAMKEYNIPKKYFDLLLGSYNAEPVANQYGLLNAFSRAANSSTLAPAESRRLQVAAGRGLLGQSTLRCDKCFQSLA